MSILNSENFHIVEGDVKGKSLFTSRGFVKGDPIYLFDYWSGEEMPIHVTNHSCDPNSTFNDEGQLIALKDLKKDEEITYNYLLHPIPASPWNFECECKSEECLGWISVSMHV